MKSNNQPKKMICESCHKEFSCGVNVSKCWCFDVTVEVKQLTKLKEDFKNCLCPECLSKHSKSVDQSVQ